MHYLFNASDSPLGMGRFKSLVNSEEGLKSFKALYKIPPGVGIWYCKEGEWHEKGGGRSGDPNDLLYRGWDEDSHEYHD